MTPQDFEQRERGAIRTYAYPTLAIFLLPLFSLWFFHHAESTYDRRMLDSIAQNVRQDAELTEEERADYLAFFRRYPVSRILKDNLPESQDLIRDIPENLRFYYATFRWMIRLALTCVVAGVVVLGSTAAGAWLARRSLRAQHLNLLAGWHLLRLFSTFQVIAQAGLIFALSFWVTALWFGFYSRELLVVAGIFVVISLLVMLKAIFQRVKLEYSVAGQELDQGAAGMLWHDVRTLCTRLNTRLPDQIIAGIDDNFFVTEQPVTVDNRTYKGRTLYVSLSLLRILLQREAEAVLIHELAHFSGADRLWGTKITPLLARYHKYLEGLANGVVSLPVWSATQAIHALQRASLAKTCQDREYRADQTAAEQTSLDDTACALLRMTAYTEYRRQVERELFDATSPHPAANICQRIDSGFREFTAGFVSRSDVIQLTTAHPFDAHPPLGERLAMLGFAATADAMRSALATPPDGVWYRKVTGAETMEESQWSRYEEQFCRFHEQVLAFRYLPATDEERALVEEYFPPITLATRDHQSVVLDCEKITCEQWDAPVYYHEIVNVTAETEWGKPQLNLVLSRDDPRTCHLPLSKQQPEQQELMNTLQHYLGRYLTAAAYQSQLQDTPEDQGGSSPSA